VTSVNVILTTDRRGDHHEVSPAKTPFPQHAVRKLLETVLRAAQLAVAMELPEDDVDGRSNASECQSISVPWCVKRGALSVGLMKAQ
jgi:hypothetical protein